MASQVHAVRVDGSDMFVVGPDIKGCVRVLRDGADARRFDALPDQRAFLELNEVRVVLPSLQSDGTTANKSGER